VARNAAATSSVFLAALIEEAISAAIDRFLATGDAAPKMKTKTPATIHRVGLRSTNCGGSHNTRDCPYEKKGGGLHNEDGTRSGFALSATSPAIPSATARS